MTRLDSINLYCFFVHRFHLPKCCSTPIATHGADAFLRGSKTLSTCILGCFLTAGSCLLSCAESAGSIRNSANLRLDHLDGRTGVADDNPAGRGLIWDLTNSMKYACWKSPSYSGVLPCLLRKHRLWHVGKARVILGQELLYGQGFDASLISEGVVKGRHVTVPVSMSELVRFCFF